MTENFNKERAHSKNKKAKTRPAPTPKKHRTEPKPGNQKPPKRQKETTSFVALLSRCLTCSFSATLTEHVE